MTGAPRAAARVSEGVAESAGAHGGPDLDELVEFAPHGGVTTPPYGGVAECITFALADGSDSRPDLNRIRSPVVTESRRLNSPSQTTTASPSSSH